MTVSSQYWNLSFSYQRSISSFLGSQHYWFLGQALLHQLCVFGKSQESFWHFPWSIIDSTHLDVNLKVFKKDNKKDIWLVENLKMGSQISNSLCDDRRVNGSLQQKPLLERKICLHCWCQQIPDTWINKSNCLTSLMM